NDYANIVGRNVAITYDYTKTQADIDNEIESYNDTVDNWPTTFPDYLFKPTPAQVADTVASIEASLGTVESKQVVELWEIGDDGKYSRDNHPCLTTNIDLTSCNLSSEIIDND
ncbi:hypothetical protein EBI01_20470, partial [Marinomonas rhizomae]|uniref:hypothetical protein n=1 Tax=Marinomonas rhizomae TaxID=491948 RepID=UPI000F3DA96D